jgi:hypothetical protein
LAGNGQRRHYQQSSRKGQNKTLRDHVEHFNLPLITNPLIIEGAKRELTYTLILRCRCDNLVANEFQRRNIPHAQVKVPPAVAARRPSDTLSGMEIGWLYD